MDEGEKTTVMALDGLTLVQQQKQGDAQRRAYFIVIRGKTVGKMYSLTQSLTMIGRSSDVDICIEDDGVSRRHAYVEHKADGLHVADNESTNGVFVNGERVKSALLEDGDRVQISTGTILKFSYQDELEENYQRKLYDDATRDGLTGAYNKKTFADRLKTEFAFCYRHNTPLSLLLFDIDFFKKVNDNFGHPAGDHVLKVLSDLVHTALRTEDIFARYGGEEFGVILRETDEDRAFLIAERIRRTIESHEFVWEDKRMSVNISIGIATLREKDHPDAKALVKAADIFLYKAKDGGRNRTESALMA